MKEEKQKRGKVSYAPYERFTTKGINPAGKIPKLNAYFVGTQKNKSIKKSPSRSFEGMREAQILRHISTKMWMYCREEWKTKVVEVEMMYAGGNVFIGANSREHSDVIFEILDCADQTAEMLHMSQKGYSIKARVNTTASRAQRTS